ncbi:hypothetical protein Pmani_031819 [Petrolisthes manimaculis]|uniref:Uncharacterized protein n=1 Tax=Petrolisthes manimaculis TaxID=1843537 RepID=A0AAE1TS91_9EUCA|nr:hypothetical protein Pmani_031819 [Petrolisthes manimaculis]
MTARKCICVVVLFLAYVSTLGICEERGLPTNHTALHVVALTEGEWKEEGGQQQKVEVGEAAFLHSACTLGYPNVKVLRGWCVECEGEGEGDDLLSVLTSLPENDLILVVNLRGEYTYLLKSYKEVHGILTTLGDTLVVIQPPSTPKEKKEKEEEDKEKGEGGGGGEDEGGDEEEVERGGGDEEGGGGEKELEGENEEEFTNAIEEEEGEEEEKEEKEKEEEEKEEEEKEDVFTSVLQGLREAAVMGRVSTLLKALKEEKVEKEKEKEEEEEEEKGPETRMVLRDTSPQYVLFGNNRHDGSLHMGIPLFVTFHPRVPEAGNTTNPLLVYSVQEENAFQNILEVFWEEEWLDEKLRRRQQREEEDEERRKRMMIEKEKQEEQEEKRRKMNSEEGNIMNHVNSEQGKKVKDENGERTSVYKSQGDTKRKEEDGGNERRQPRGKENDEKKKKKKKKEQIKGGGLDSTREATPRLACPLAPETILQTAPGTARVVVVMELGDEWWPFLEEVLKGLAVQDYTKRLMEVWFDTKTGPRQEEVLEAFMDQHRHQYAALRVTWDQPTPYHLLR